MSPKQKLLQLVKKYNNKYGIYELLAYLLCDGELVYRYVDKELQEIIHNKTNLQMGDGYLLAPFLSSEKIGNLFDGSLRNKFLEGLEIE